MASKPFLKKIYILSVNINKNQTVSTNFDHAPTVDDVLNLLDKNDLQHVSTVEESIIWRKY